MRSAIVIALVAFSSTALAGPQQHPSGKTSSVHKVADTGPLNEADLVAIARMKAQVSKDQFSEDRTSAYIGREFLISIPTSRLVSYYDAETHTLRVSLSNQTGTNTIDTLDLASDVKRSLYAGQNGFGAKATVIKERGDTFGITLSRSYRDREKLSYTTILDGEAARTLSKSIVLRISGTVKGTGASAVATGLSVSQATLDRPIDTFVDKYAVAVQVTRIEWIDGRTGRTLSSQEVAPATSEERPRGELSVALNPAGKIWLQLTSSIDPKALPIAFERLRSKSPDLLEGIRPYVSKSSGLARLLVGPFRSEADAQIFATNLQSVGIDALRWVSSKQDRIEPLKN